MLKISQKNTTQQPVPKWLSNPLDIFGLWLKISSIAFVAVYTRAIPTQPTWAMVLILWAAFILVPIGIQQTAKRQERFSNTDYEFFFEFCAAVLLSISFCLEKGVTSGLLSIFYVVWCVSYAFSQFFVLIRKSSNGKLISSSPLLNLSFFITWGFLANAAVWIVFDRFNYIPLNFSPWIVLLTGAHFHYAGFALMMSLTLLLSDKPNDFRAKLAIIAVIIGVVCTAAGITLTQLGFSPLLETIAGVIMSAAGFLSGLVFFLESFSRKQKSVTWLWRMGGLCLMCAMILALLYTLRTIFIVTFLNLGFMQAVHGTLNALGFGTLMLVGWSLKKSN